MKRIAITALALLFLSPQISRGQAEDPGRLKAAEELVRLMYATESHGDIAGAIVEAKIQADPKLESDRAVLLDWAKKIDTWETLGPPTIALYARQFSEAEIRDIIAFYRTPTGQKVLEHMPSMLTGVTGAGFSLAKDWQTDVEQLTIAKKEKVGAYALREHADQLFDEQKWSAAKNAYLRYMELRPDDVDAMTDLGSCYRGLGDSQNAVTTFDRALTLNPEHWQSLFNKIVVVAFDLDRKPEALELLAKLRALQPENPDVEKLAERLAEK
jgi:hypothetical protein